MDATTIVLEGKVRKGLPIDTWIENEAIPQLAEQIEPELLQEHELHGRSVIEHRHHHHHQK